MKQIPVNCNIVYANGDSWVYGSELRDNSRLDIKDDFNEVHSSYRHAHVWPTLVAESLGLDITNESEAGGSNERTVRKTMFDVSKLLERGYRPFVIIGWTQLQRFELPKGPDGHFWRSFVGPAAKDNPDVATEIWANWNSDRTDLIKWLQQVILLDAFLKVNNVPYFGITVFKEIYWLFEKYNLTDDFHPYMYQLTKNVDLTRHSYNFSLESILRQHTSIKYGPGGHPLDNGQVVIADYVKAQINSRFKIN